MAQERDGVFTWIHADHLSSATRITDVNGLEIRRLAYASFGEEAENQGSDESPKYTYTGKEQDSTGLSYYGARYYDPALSRFITADTVYDVGPQGLNRYSYALNNPIIYRDPTGHQVMEGAIGGTAVCGPPCTVAGALIGLGLGLGIGTWIVHSQPVDEVEEGSDVIPLLQIPDDAIPAESDDEIPGEPDDGPPPEPEDPKEPGRRPPFPYSKKSDEGLEISSKASTALKSEGTNSLSNLGSGFSRRNASTLDDFGSGSAFSGVYNPQSKQFLAYPSGDTLLADGTIPQNLVPRRGGHGVANRQFSELTGVDPQSNVGFTMFLEEDGTISVHWLSRGVNGLNPAFQGDTVPLSMRPQIIEEIQAATGKTVSSR